MSKELSWTVSNLTWKDEDTGTEYMEITTTLKVDLLDTDKVKFHIEFKSDKQTTIVANSALLADGFECSLEKETASDYWKTTVSDLYVRVADTPVTDFSNA